jgi:adenylate cyclase
MLLASRRLVGDDGPYVSVRETSEETGIDLELLQRIRRAMGLPTVDDPDATVHLRADAEAAAYAQRFIEFGIEPEQIVLITRVLAEGLARAAEVMRYAALAAVLKPGATELEIAKGSEALVREIAPMLGPYRTDVPG